MAIGRVCHHILKRQYPFYPIRDIFCCLLRFSQGKITDSVTIQEDTAFNLQQRRVKIFYFYDSLGHLMLTWRLKYFYLSRL